MHPGQTESVANAGGEHADEPTRLLLVDHHLSFRAPLAFMLEREPDLTVTAHGGTMAEVQSLLPGVSDRLDVALIGLQLPDGNGVDLIELIHAHRAGCQIVALTSIEDRREHAHAIAAGAAGVLHKSASIEIITAAIRKAHRGEPLHTSAEMVSLLRLAAQHRDEEEAARHALTRLTPREREILLALADGLSDKEIAARLHVSINTVAAHMVSVLSKLGVHSRLQAVLVAIRHGIVVLR